MYQGIVTAIATAPHPNADRLKLGLCHGYTVVVGLDTKDGDLGIFFPCDGRFSDEMLDANKLRKAQGGYFDDNGRIRAQKFRGVKSEGIWLPLESVKWADSGFSQIAPGTSIDTLNGKVVCEKYYTPATLKAMARGQTVKVKRGETPWFRKQPDTPQLRFILESIPDGSLIYFTEKLHGTSGRFGLALETKPMPWWRKLLRLGPVKTWEKLVGSKNVILTHKPEGGYYADESFRFSVMDLPLHKGETLYYEIVGYTPGGGHIMAPQTVKDPELVKKYGKQMVYRYGVEPGQSRIYVYRITRTNEDGAVTELSWPQVKGRCRELGVSPCPDVRSGQDVPMLFDSREYVEKTADSLLEGPSVLDATHIREGIVLRIEQPDGQIRFAKHKSFDFKVLEGIIKDDQNYVDREEIA